MFLIILIYQRGEILLQFYRQGKLEEAKLIKLPISMRNRWGE